MFQRILNFFFNYGSSTNLRNVHVHSDRGHLVPDIVFNFFLTCGAEVLGTAKRLAKCWPFTYSQKVGESGKRTLLSEKGASSLFLKRCSDGKKDLYSDIIFCVLKIKRHSRLALSSKLQFNLLSS